MRTSVMSRLIAALVAATITATGVSTGADLFGTRVKEKKLPVGYDHPASDQGGPALTDGFAWLDQCRTNILILAPKPAGGKLTVLFLTGPAGIVSVHELTRRFPMEALVLAPDEGQPFPGRDKFDALLNHRHVDVFVFYRMGTGALPSEVQYEVLRRVKEDGAGLVAVGFSSDTFNSKFLRLKPTLQGTNVVGGIPVGGLEQWRITAPPLKFQGLHLWNTYGDVYTGVPEPSPYTFGSIEVSPFGKGRIITGMSDWNVPASLPRERIQADYGCSYAAKVILLASGRIPAVQVTGMSPGNAAKRGERPAVTFSVPAGKPFAGRIRWQIRDMWGSLSSSGVQPLALPVLLSATVGLDGAVLRNAGRQYLDVWVENAAGQTADWASGFVNVQGSLPPPEIAFKYPNGAPRGAALEGTIRVKGAMGGARLRVTLIDRYDREVGLQEQVLGTNAVLAFVFPSAGLPGQIWRVQADVAAEDGALLARNDLTVTSPSRPECSSFYPHMVGMNAIPEMNEYLRRIGFLASGAGDRLGAENLLWNDLQGIAFPINIRGPQNNFTAEWLTDYEDPAVRRDFAEATAAIVRTLMPYGLRCINMTDDSAPGTELPLGAYTTVAFHEWLKARYGNFDAVCKAWNWTPPVETTPPGELPYNPYVVIRFHQWLAQKYTNLTGVAAAWNIKQAMHTFGAIQRDMIAAQTKGSNAVPAEDVRLFLAADAKTPPPADPFGAIQAVSVHKAYDSGAIAPWYDARHFMEELWVNDMAWVKEAATRVDPTVRVGAAAAYYKSVYAEACTRLDYIAPYYNDLAIKVAVDRGRIRRPGNYGACLGAYGPKPVNMAGRRAQIWDILFAGGSGFWYWSFPNGGMNADLTLSDAHAKYQCEVVEELSRGISELFAGNTRIFDPIAILDSVTSSLCDEEEKKGEPLSSQDNSLAAFHYVCEDLGLNPQTVLGEELAAGWLEKNKIRVLLLPEVNSLSDAEANAIRKFADAGGTVIADVRPGARYPNGNLRDKAALDDVFGIATDSRATARRAQGALKGKAGAEDAPELDFGDAFVDPRIQATNAVALARVGAAPAILMNRVGKGRAVLFNASFLTYTSRRSEGGEIWRPWHAVMKNLTAAAGVMPIMTMTSEGKDTPGLEISPFRNGKGYLLGVADLGCRDFAGARRPFEVKLPGVFHHYDVRAGKYLGYGDTLKADIPRGGHRAYCLLPYAVRGITVGADKTSLKAGETLTLSVDLAADGATERDNHVVRIEARDPAGQPFFPFFRVLSLPAKGPLGVPLTTARNDTPGKWGITVTDVNTGLAETFTFTLK